VFYHEALGGKYVPCAVLFDLESGDRRCNQKSPLGQHFRPNSLVSYALEKKLG
jgi:tubulin beta